MMFVFALDGTGEDADPFRVNMPRYTLVSVDYAAKTAVAKVDPADIHSEIEPFQHRPPPAARGPLPAGVPSAEAYTAWYSLLDIRYREHAGEFRPKLV